MFRPSLTVTLVTLFPALLFCSLGTWQLQRAELKQQRIERHEAAAHHAGLPNEDSAQEFTRVTVEGRFDRERHVLADNQLLNGRPGVHVYTPFRTEEGTTVLVNRGWLPLPDRRALPGVPADAGVHAISGRLGPIPGAGRQLGPTDQVSGDRWPQLLTYPDLGLISTALDRELYPMVLFLDPDSPGGFDGRHWPPVFMTPARHRAYAFQWFALAATAVVAWVLLGLRRSRVA
jgi:surfeit locus 1 family protein